MPLQGAPDSQIRIVVMGNSGVGKSSIIRRYLTPKNREVDSTLEVEYTSHSIKHNNKNIQLQIWDTAGSLELHQNKTVQPSYFRGAHAIILVYDVSSRQSFEDLGRWVTQVGKIASPNNFKFVVGNKCDLVVERAISSEDAEQAVKGYDEHAEYIEVSAHKNFNIDTLFENIIEKYEENFIQGNKNRSPYDKVTDKDKTDGIDRRRCILI